MDAFKFASRRNFIDIWVEGDVKVGVINVILDNCSMTWRRKTVTEDILVK